MDKIHILDVPGMEFPSGRRTRVILGANGAMPGGEFCQGYVVMYPGGSIPPHAHDASESYTILRGDGVMTVDGEEQPVRPLDMVFIQGGKTHGLRNDGEEELHMMFVYAPNIIAEHWAQETQGTLR